MNAVNITILAFFLLVASKYACVGFLFPAFCFVGLGFTFFLLFWIPNNDDF